jgi:CheY-like chemotaxis protein
MNHELLYIEDELANIELLKRVVGLRPHIHLHVATTAAGGIRAATLHSVALILLDNRLPDGSGADVLTELRNTPTTGATPIAIITGDSGRAAAQQLLELGATYFIEKPLDLADLLRIIDRHIPNHEPPTPNP